MIVRIMGEGQFEVSDDIVAQLNELDTALDKDLSDGTEAHFRVHLANMIELVRGAGTPVADDTLVPSDSIVPPADITIEELRSMLGDAGLVPG